MRFYKTYEYSPYVVGDDNNPVEIYCGLSLEKAKAKAEKRFAEISGDIYIVECFVIECNMTDEGVEHIGCIFRLSNNR